jgi:hypothetical protein
VTGRPRWGSRSAPPSAYLLRPLPQEPPPPDGSHREARDAPHHARSAGFREHYLPLPCLSFPDFDLRLGGSADPRLPSRDPETLVQPPSPSCAGSDPRTPFIPPRGSSSPSAFALALGFWCGRRRARFGPPSGVACFPGSAIQLAMIADGIPAIHPQSSEPRIVLETFAA